MGNQKNSGNRCGFTPGQYRQPVLPECSTRPKFIRAVQKRIKERGFKQPVRAERDEALRAVLITILDHTCLCQGGIGYADLNGKGWYSYSWLQIKGYIPWLSETRFWECIKQLKELGWLVSEQRMTHPGQRKLFKNRTSASNYVVSHKMLTEAFWSACGVSKAWRQQAAAKRSRMAQVATKNGITIDQLFRIRLCRPAPSAPVATPSCPGGSYAHIRCHLIPKLASLLPHHKDIESLANALIGKYGGSILDASVLSWAITEI